MKPRVLNKRTDTIPPDAVYVGRPSKWGNPYQLGDKNTLLVRKSREEVIDLYRAHLIFSGLIDDIQELRGKDLVCWCAPLPCHADVLLELANAKGEVVGHCEGIPVVKTDYLKEE